MKCIVVGAGLAGIVAARILKDHGHSVEIFEKKNHIGGVCYDSVINNVLVHNYGGHIFHTNSIEVKKFLSRFGDFFHYWHKVYANTKLGFMSVPINKQHDIDYGFFTEERCKDIIFKDYSSKQWGLPFSQIPKCLYERVVYKRNSFVDSYFLDKWQGLPINGYTNLFYKILGKDIPFNLNCNDRSWKKEKYNLLVFTGKLDEYFDYSLGELKYRSLRFEHRQEPRRPWCVVNECNQKPYTRSYDNSFWSYYPPPELSVVTYEFPTLHSPGINDPLYPFPDNKNLSLKQSYLELSKNEKNTIFLGRLGTFEYLNMDATIMQVMEKLKNI